MEAYQDVGKTRYRFIKSAIYDYLRNGTTIIYNRINNEPFADNLAKQVAQFARAQTIVSGYLAFGSDSSYGNHWDTRDVFAVQLVGKKTLDTFRAQFRYAALYAAGQRYAAHQAAASYRYGSGA